MEKKQFQEEFDEARVYYDSILDRELFALFKKTQLTLSTAEGYTGGLLAQRISKFQGSNSFYKAGIISSDPKTQINLFNITPSIVRQHGLISTETSTDICNQLQKQFSTDICISTLGIKNQDNNIEDICYFGIKIKEDIKIKQFILTGGIESKRQTIIQGCLSYLKTGLQNKIMSLQIN